MCKGQQARDNILVPWQVFPKTQDFQHQHVVAETDRQSYRG